VSSASATVEKVFAANRSEGRVAFTAAVADGLTRRTRVAEEGALRVRFPAAGRGELEAVLVNTAGGMTGGDRFRIEAAAGPGAQVLIGTTAAEKVYRSLGPAATVDIRLSVAAGAALRWLPQETILFDRARLTRRIDVELDEGGTLVLAEAVVFGRSAMGEAVVHGELIDSWRVRLGGRLVFAESVRLSGDIASRLADPAVAAGGCAIATVLMVPGDERHVTAARAQAFCGEVGTSCWNGIAVARFVARDGAVLRRDMTAVLAAFAAGSLPKLWIN
jgi:urease accessory protein